MQEAINKNPVLSIIIPTLNEEKRIASTLKNLSKLSSISHEIIISDGNSSDNTIKIAEKYADRVVVYKGKKRQTIAAGRNLGAKKAKGAYLVFLDADDIIPDLNDFFAKAMQNFEENRKLVALTANIRVIPENETFPDKIIFSCLNTQHFIANNILRIGIASGEFQMIKKDCFKKLNGYNEALIAGEDYDMFTRLSKIGRTKIDTKLTVYHSGRRAKKVGWPKLLYEWISNFFSRIILKRSLSKEWKVIR